MFRHVWSAAALLSLVAVCGCGGSSDQVEVFPVKGVVTFNGKPMIGGGSISFVPTGGQKGKSAAGTIEPDGTYTLGTYAEDDGSMTGDFRVVITQVTVEESPNVGDDGGVPSPGSITVVEEADRIPLIYADFANSPLTAKVEAKDDNVIDFTLEPK